MEHYSKDKRVGRSIAHSCVALKVSCFLIFFISTFFIDVQAPFNVNHA